MGVPEQGLSLGHIAALLRLEKPDSTSTVHREATSTTAQTRGKRGWAAVLPPSWSSAGWPGSLLEVCPHPHSVMVVLCFSPDGPVLPRCELSELNQRARDCSPGHAGKEGPQLARTGASQGFPRAARQRSRHCILDSPWVPCSALKGETVPDSLHATPKSSPTRRVP